MSALFYLRSADALRTFVVDPRVSYSYSSITGGATGKTWSGQLFFGAEYALGRRFGVFGEAGLSYGRTTATRIGPSGETIPTMLTTARPIVNGVEVLYRF